MLILSMLWSQKKPSLQDMRVASSPICLTKKMERWISIWMTSFHPCKSYLEMVTWNETSKSMLFALSVILLWTVAKSSWTSSWLQPSRWLLSHLLKVWRPWTMRWMRQSRSLCKNCVVKSSRSIPLFCWLLRMVRKCSCSMTTWVKYLTSLKS